MNAAFEQIASYPRTLMVLVAALSLACGAPASPTPEETMPPIPTQAVQRPATSPTAETPVTPTATDTPTAMDPSPGYDPTDTMFRMFSGVGHPMVDAVQALRLVRDEKDVSQVRVIVEIMRFWEPRLVSVAADTLAELTGQDFREDVNEWGSWMEWLGKRPGEYRPHRAI